MTRTDALTGLRHAWALHRAEILWFAGYQVLLAGLLAILGAPVVLAVLVLCAAIVPLITRTVQEARAYADHRLFVDWLTTSAPADL